MRTAMAMTVHVLQELGQRWWAKALLSILAFLFGGDAAVYLAYRALLVLMILDLITGVWRAAKEQRLAWKFGISSSLAKFAVYLLFVATARMLDVVAGAAVGVPSAAVAKVAWVYIAAQEGVSIDANLRAIYGVGLSSILSAFRRVTNGGQ